MASAGWTIYEINSSQGTMQLHKHMEDSPYNLDFAVTIVYLTQGIPVADYFVNKSWTFCRQYIDELWPVLDPGTNISVMLFHGIVANFYADPHPAQEEIK